MSATLDVTREIDDLEASGRVSNLAGDRNFYFWIVVYVDIGLREQCRRLHALRFQERPLVLQQAAASQ